MCLTARRLALKNKTLAISCVVPVFNEEGVIEKFISKLQNKLSELTEHFEIIVVDDGSQDETIAKILQLPKESKVKLLGLSRNFGKEIALTAGLEYASGEVTILLDADFQHPIKIIPIFLEHWAEGFDMVYGTRKNRVDESRLKRNASQLFYWLMKKITNINIPNDAGDFRLMDRKVVDAIKQFPERTRFMKGIYAWVGFRKIGVPYTVEKRIAGKSSWGFTKLAKLALVGITSFSDVPLRVWGFIGFLISFISLIYAIYIVTVTLLFGADLPGFPTLIVSIMFLGGVQLLSIGILGEYISRIFNEVKQRPRYLVQIKNGFNE